MLVSAADRDVKIRPNDGGRASLTRFEWSNKNAAAQGFYPESKASVGQWHRIV